MANRLDHATYLTVTPLTDGDAVPVVNPFPAAIDNGGKLRRSIFKRHAVQKLLLFLVIQGAQHAYRVFTLQAKTRMHQLVS